MLARARGAVLAAAPFLLLPVCWLPTWLVGGATYAPPLLFFVPILLMALRGRPLPTVVVALLSTVAAGPLTPENFDTGEMQHVSDWLIRGVFFLGAGIGVAIAARRLRHRALHDPLTGLPNRAMLDEHLTLAIARARRSGRSLALGCIDLDDFKLVNDNLGHAAGDRLLREVAERLGRSLRETDVLARQGGDEFLVLFADFVDGDDACRAAQTAFDRIRTELEAPFRLEGAELAIGLSMGVSVFPEDAGDSETLRRHADASMYRAKDAGGGLVLFQEDEAPAPLARLSLAARLRRAIDGGELELHYQPVWNLQEGGIVGMESLVRWRHPRRGLVPPMEFIPVAEQTGVIDALGDWVIDQACRQGRQWRDVGLDPMIGVNVSPYQLRRHEFAARFTALLDRHAFPADRFVLELTESAWMLDGDRTLPVLEALRDAGVMLALDDFGAGYSSLARLLHLPLHALKVDRQFLAGVPDRPEATAVLEAIMRLASTCGFEVVVEGVETAAHREAVRRLGCTLAQGYGLTRPLPAGDATAALLEHLSPALRRTQDPRAHAH